MEMSSSGKTLTLLEQKRIQWAKEREEMVGLCGLWGHPKYRTKTEIGKFEEFHIRKNVLPPIPARGEPDEKGNFKPEEESETSGYLSDSPKHSNEKEPMRDNRYKEENGNGEWYTKEEKRDTYTTDETTDESHGSYVLDRKSYKNYKNEKWAQQSSDSWQRRNSKNWWFGTPESISSDDGSRLRWGDRGVGIGHLWEPVVHQPDSRLPQLESYRPTPKWVERGLRQADGSQKADILIIHHPDDDNYKNYSSDGQIRKNFILGQNVRLTPEVLEERERKRRKALEHQNAIRQQLEDRERKRKEERLNKLREERMEDERIKREQETERLRMEEEQRRNREREEKEKRKELAMKEAIEIAERKAREEKRHQRKHIQEQEAEEVPQTKEKTSECSREKKNSVRTPKTVVHEDCKVKTCRSEKSGVDKQMDVGRVKSRKDSSSQFEQLRVPNGMQFLNMNNIPMDGSLALVLDNPSPENNFLLPTDGVQLALLMSPGNVGSGQIIPLQTPIPTAITPRGRTLTPSKFRLLDNGNLSQRSKTTQTDGRCCSASIKSSRTMPRSRKQSRRSGRVSGGSDSSEKSNSLERPHAHYNCTSTSKRRSRSQPKFTIEDRPKWGINRPSVQYKKQSEKDIYYQKRIRQRLKKMNDASTSTETSPKGKDKEEEKPLESEMRLLKCTTDDDEPQPKKPKDEVLKNGYRMKSNPSSPLFVPIDSDRTGTENDEGQDFVLELTVEPELVNEGKAEIVVEEDFEDTAVAGSVGFVTKAQLDAIKQIASLREGLKKLQLDFSSSRSVTPYSETNDKKKEPTQVLDLSKVKITSKEDFKKYFDKVPEFKIKPEKVVPESIKIRDKDFSFTPGRREGKQAKEWSFPDPTPPDMRSVKLEDLCPVNIDWKMLTTLRPKTRVEEEMFSRLVQLGKLDLKYQQALRREKVTDWVRKTKNPRSSIVEVRVLSCKECGEDFCDGSLCSKMTYDSFSRNQASGTAEVIKNFKIPEAPKKKKRKQKRKSRKRTRSKVKRTKPRKNSIFNRPATTGCSRDHSRRGSHAKAEKMRSSSLNRIPSERKAAFLKLNRSKSAPRLRFKRDTSDPAFATRSEYASDSAPTQTDYSSQSDTESYKNRESSPESTKGKHSVRVGFVESNPTYHSRKRGSRSYSTHRSDSDAAGFDSRESSTDRSSRSAASKTPETSPSRTGTKYPTTIQIKFDGFHPSSSVFIPRKSYAPNKLGYTRRGEPLTVPRNQEVTKIMEGFTRIDLSFMDDEQTSSKVDNPVVSPKRVSSRFSRSRTRFNMEPLPSTSYVRGKGLLAKFLDRKKS